MQPRNRTIRSLTTRCWAGGCWAASRRAGLGMGGSRMSARVADEFTTELAGGSYAWPEETAHARR
jgi:hypothetical protein